MSLLIPLALVVVLCFALARTMAHLGRCASENRRLKDEVEALKMQLDIAARDIDADTAYNGLRKQ